MKKSNLIASGILLILFAAYLVFIWVKKSGQRDENVFLSATKSGYTSAALSGGEDQVLIRYRQDNFRLKDLPEDIQKRIRNEQLTAHVKIQTILKDYLARYHALTKKAESNGKKLDGQVMPSLNQLAAEKIEKGKVEELYKKNIKVFPENHNPENIKRQIYVELVANKAYEFIKIFLSEAYLKEGVKFPLAPKIPEKWFNELPMRFEFGSESAPNHLVWVGNFGCERCETYTADVGLLIKKFSTENLKLTFIPWTKNAVDSLVYLNNLAACVAKEYSAKEFWKFHALMMSSSKDLKTLKPEDYQRAEGFAKDRFLALKEGLTLQDWEKVNKCGRNTELSNSLFAKLQETRRDLGFIPDLDGSNFYLNGHGLDLEARRLFLAVESLLSSEVK